jgi:hypothetical protein
VPGTGQVDPCGGEAVVSFAFQRFADGSFALPVALCLHHAAAELAVRAETERRTLMGVS